MLVPSERIGFDVALAEHAVASAEARRMERALVRHAEAHAEGADGLQCGSGLARRGFSRGKACGEGSGEACRGSRPAGGWAPAWLRLSTQMLRPRRGVWRGLRRAVRRLTSSEQMGSGMATAERIEASAVAMRVERVRRLMLR